MREILAREAQDDGGRQDDGAEAEGVAEVGAEDVAPDVEAGGGERPGRPGGHPDGGNGAGHLGAVAGGRGGAGKVAQGGRGGRGTYKGLLFIRGRSLAMEKPHSTHVNASFPMRENRGGLPLPSMSQHVLAARNFSASISAPSRHPIRFRTFSGRSDSPFFVGRV